MIDVTGMCTCLCRALLPRRSLPGNGFKMSILRVLDKYFVALIVLFLTKGRGVGNEQNERRGVGDTGFQLWNE